MINSALLKILLCMVMGRRLEKITLKRRGGSIHQKGGSTYQRPKFFQANGDVPFQAGNIFLRIRGCIGSCQ